MFSAKNVIDRHVEVGAKGKLARVEYKLINIKISDLSLLAGGKQKRLKTLRQF